MSDERLRQKLAQLDAELSSDGEEENQEQEKTRTREKLAAVEEKLAKCMVGEIQNFETKIRTNQSEARHHLNRINY